MRRVVKPTRDGIEYYREIATAKYSVRDDLYALEDRVAVAFKDYVSKCPDFHTALRPVLNDDERTVLRAAYEDRCEPLNLLWSDVLARAHLRLCCYCQMDPATAADHVFPIDECEAYSVLNLNLVPSCSTCNSKKGKKMVGIPPIGRLFFHAYTEELESVRWLRASVVMQASIPVVRYDLDVTAVASVALRQLILTQYSELELLDRYSQRFTEHGLSDARTAYKTALGLGAAPRFAKVLASTAAAHVDTHGMNHFLTVGFDALSRAPQFAVY